MSIDKKKAAKEIIKFGCSIAVGTTVSLFFKQNIVKDGLYSKIACAVGGGVIGFVVTDRVDDYIDKLFTDFENYIKEVEEIKHGNIEKETVEVEE